MVFYYTSANMKILRNVYLDYASASDITPFEYMKTYLYIGKCLENVEESKITWIAETFLGMEKHLNFLKEIANHLSNELSDEEQDYCIIIFYGITFEIPTKDMELLYKSMFNISKTLLNTFTDFLSNNEVLTFISQVAQTYYDANYITEKIIDPLFAWQPYISEMAHTYAEYVKKLENRKLKPPTIPVQPVVLSRKGKEPGRAISQPSLPATPPNSTFVKSKGRMLTKSVIDRRLKNIHEKNKQKAEHLLNTVKNNEFHFAQTKTDRTKKNTDTKDVVVDVNVVTTFQKPKKIASRAVVPPVRETITTIKRLNQRVQTTEKQEVEWLQSLVSCCRNPNKIDELIENDRQEREKEALHEIERKHLMGQISHEEAILARNNVVEQNKKKYEDFQAERMKWNADMQKWKKTELAKSRTRIEKLSLLELSIMEAKQAIVTKNKEIADKVKEDNERMIAEAIKLKQEELEKRIKMIKEINILSLIAKKAKVPKIIDLTESSGIGLLCEMSIAELQERVAAMKIGIKDELDRKKCLIKEENESAKRELEDVKNTIKAFFNERAEIKKQAKMAKKPAVILDGATAKEIDDLKKVLEDKRNLRMKLNTKVKV